MMNARNVLVVMCTIAAALPFAAAQPPTGEGQGPPRGRHAGPPPLNLDTADADGDGLISQSEFEAVMADNVTARFTRMDADGDGVLSTEEFKKPAMRGPRGDGSERPEGPPPGGPPPGDDPPAGGTRRGNGGPPPGDRGPRPGPPDPKTLDTDQDGSVSFEEFYAPAKAHAAQLFTRLDANSDGSLDTTEAAKPAGPRRGPGREGERGGERGGRRGPPEQGQPE